MVNDKGIVGTDKGELLFCGQRPLVHSVPDLNPELLKLFAVNFSIAEELLLTGDPNTPSLKVAPE